MNLRFHKHSCKVGCFVVMCQFEKADATDARKNILIRVSVAYISQNKTALKPRKSKLIHYPANLVILGHSRYENSYPCHIPDMVYFRAWLC